MNRLMVREENRHRLGYAQCAGGLRPVERFHLSVQFRLPAPPVIWVEKHRQSLLISTHKTSVLGPQHASPTSAEH